MPLSELYRLAKGKLDSTLDKNTSCSNGLSSGPENDFVELVWENGQIMMQGQSSRTRKAPTHSPKPRDKVGNGANTQYEKFDLMDSELNEFQIPGPSGEMGLNQNDDLVPWLNYPIDKPVQHGYRSDFMTGLSGVTVNQNQLSSVRSNPGSSSSSHRSKASVVMNFSHFSRPVAHVKANLQSNGVNPAKDESKLFGSSNGVLKEAKANLEDVPVEEPVAVKQSEFTHQDNALREDKSSNQIAESSIKGVLDVEKAVEPVVASSSVCSGNSIERPSDDATHNSKRKFHDTEDSEWPSEDVEEESMDVKRGAHARAGSSSKRSRAAEVHNLSERRRRDRINEKMRALQELIPNCNKVDKASMLDEAIEYLKTLQLQVQIMSMGAGLYMPPMMMPPGMQHMHAAHMGHFSPMVGMGMGMGMGMGLGMGMHYGMGMPEINGGSSGFPMIHVPPVQAAPFPGPPIAPSMPAPPAMHGIVGSNRSLLDPLSQGHPVAMTLAPSTPLPGGPPMKSAVGEDPSAGPRQNLGSSLVSRSTDLMQNACTNSSMNHKTSTTQCQATKKDPDQSALVQNNGQVAEVNVGEAGNDAD